MRHSTDLSDVQSGGGEPSSAPPFLTYAATSVAKQSAFLAAVVIPYIGVTYVLGSELWKVAFIAATANIPGWIVLQAVLLATLRRRYPMLREGISVALGPFVGGVLFLQFQFIGLAVAAGLIGPGITYLPVWVAARIALFLWRRKKGSGAEA